VVPTKLYVTTSTVSLLDDFMPDSAEADQDARPRNNSAIHIRITKAKD